MRAWFLDTRWLSPKPVLPLSPVRVAISESRLPICIPFLSVLVNFARAHCGSAASHRHDALSRQTLRLRQAIAIQMQRTSKTTKRKKTRPESRVFDAVFLNQAE
jgi:hypothetical protein